MSCDDRKFRKPLMEKKRRARINESLDNLKQILLECDPESVNKKNAKLEKADILEMTVKYLQNMKKKTPAPVYCNDYSYKNYSSASKYGGGYSQNYVAAPFSSGSQMYYGSYGSSSYSYQKSYNYKQASPQGTSKNGIWRPW